MIDSELPFFGFGVDIPKIIWQTGKEDFENLQYPFNINVETWKQVNPEWEYRYSNQKEKISQINDFGDKDLSELSSKLWGAFLADLWRYIVIYNHGGVYVDLDTVARLPLDIIKYNITNKLNETFIMPDLGKWGYGTPNSPTTSMLVYKGSEDGKRVYCQGCYDFVEYILERNGNKKIYLPNSSFAAIKRAKPIKYVLDEVKARFAMFKKLHDYDIDGIHGSILLSVDCSAWDYAINKNPKLVAQNFIYQYDATPLKGSLWENESNKNKILFKDEFIDYEILQINKTSYNKFINKAVD